MEEAKELEAGKVVVKDEDIDDDDKLNTIENAIQVTEAEEKATIEGGDLGMARPQTTPSSDQNDRDRVELQRD
ncbi:hypothetical protein EI94DRAFT_1807540 [Lactarius quietus]|nr:hypothetical protein EI94DRAFT_1807540 [Lactarius quietus]